MSDTKPIDDHSCSYFCDRPECLKSQRDSMREKLKRIHDAEMPEEPDGLHGGMVDAYQLTKIHQYAVALKAYVQRKDAEAREQRERAERYKGIASAFQVDWNKEIDMREKAEKEKAALIAENEGLRIDAARYRKASTLAATGNLPTAWLEGYTFKELDEAIDNAMDEGRK